MKLFFDFSPKMQMQVTRTALPTTNFLLKNVKYRNWHKQGCKYNSYKIINLIKFHFSSILHVSKFVGNRCKMLPTAMFVCCWQETI